jgi:FdrA protein
MSIVVEVRRNTYQDSVTLMRLSSDLLAEDGVTNASIMMGSAGNIEIMREGGLDAPALNDARPTDLVIAIVAASEDAARTAIEKAIAALNTDASTASDGGGAQKRAISSVMGAVVEGVNLTLISVPGEYAAAEAMKALKAGMHVHLFSDNVSVEKEIALKDVAISKGLLMMGPDCGTAIINGVPVGFANAVRRGRIGVIAASGTGAQEVTSLIHELGSGISQAFGTGGRDLSSAVKGRMARFALKALLDDDMTDVIVLISKPPAPEVAASILDTAKGTSKPIVVCFLGGDSKMVRDHGLIPAETLEDAARQAVRAETGSDTGSRYAPAPTLPKLSKEQKYVRGLFSGGTFCYEALLLLREFVGDVSSNTPINKQMKLKNNNISTGHVCIDFGEDEFTVGRPHPMLDFRFRNDRIVQEARDPETAVILLDLVLGYGANANPAGALMPAIRKAMEVARAEGRTLPIVASVCGTSDDLQGLEQQEAALREAGVTILSSNAQASRFAGKIAQVAQITQK